MGDLAYLAGEQIVTWQLIDANSGRTIGAKRVVGGDLIAAADRVVAGALALVARETGMDGFPEAPSLATLTTRSSESFRLYVAGVRALEDQFFGVALDSLEKAVAIDSTFAMAHLALSRLHSLRPGGIGNARGVRRHAQAAWDNRFRLGRKERARVEVWQAQRQARLADVNNLFSQMLAEWPDDREMISDRLDFLYYYWYFADALQEVERALATYADDPDLLRYQNILLSALGRHDQALRVARRCVALEPDVASHYFQLCARWLAVGEPDSAELAVRNALARKPDYLLARIQRAQCQYAKGDLTAATVTMEKIAREADLDPMDAVRVLTSSSFRPSLTMLYGEAGRHEEAIAAFGRAEGLTRSAGTRLAIESRRHRYLLRQGQYRETLAWSNRILFAQEDRGQWFNAQLNRIGALALADSAGAARLAADALISAADSLGGLSTFMARRGLITLLLRINQPAKALDLIQEVRKDGLPTGGMFDLELRDSEIEALVLENCLAEAQHALHEQLRLYGGHAKAHLSLGRVLEEQGHATEAAAHYRQFLKAWAQANPDLPQVLAAKASLARL
jgi:tetratricopeptide (TPR) repeat protein